LPMFRLRAFFFGGGVTRSRLRLEERAGGNVGGVR